MKRIISSPKKKDSMLIIKFSPFLIGWGEGYIRKMGKLILSGLAHFQPTVTVPLL